MNIQDHSTPLESFRFGLANPRCILWILALLALPLGGWANDEGLWQPLIDRDLTQFDRWLGVPHTSVSGLPSGALQADRPEDGVPLGLNCDPKNVFSVVEEEGTLVLRISGEVYGGLTTRQAWSNFHFSCQVRWGSKKWPPRLNAKRDSGFLYHATGPHGVVSGAWMRSVECQIQEGDFGDLYLLSGTGGDVRTRRRTDPAPGEAPRIWDPEQSAESAFRVARSVDYENPTGEWTAVEVYAVGRESVHLVNGHVVMAVENIRLRDGTPLSSGHLQIQSEGAEVDYRDIRIRSVSAIPAEIRREAHFD